MAQENVSFIDIIIKYLSGGGGGGGEGRGAN